MKPRISILVSARKNSKYLAKFMNGFLRNTINADDIEILVMMNEHDTWNDDLVELFGNRKVFDVQFFREDYQLGRAGLHIYFNDLYKHARGDWIIYFCEDHYIITHGWDAVMRSLLAGTLEAEQVPMDSGLHPHGVLDPAKVWAIIPKFDNAGSMNHMLSRGFIEHMGGQLAQHGNLDSYINDVIRWIPRDRRINMDMALFHDFTHDHPNPMSDAHLQSVISEKGKHMPHYDSPEIIEATAADVVKLQQAIENGA